jgi:hypothetical protein
MTEMNSHVHGMHPIVLITFLHFALKSYFINHQVFLTHLVQAGPDLTKDRESQAAPRVTYFIKKTPSQ